MFNILNKIFHGCMVLFIIGSIDFIILFYVNKYRHNNDTYNYKIVTITGGYNGEYSYYTNKYEILNNNAIKFFDEIAKKDVVIQQYEIIYNKTKEIK